MDVVLPPPLAVHFLYEKKKKTRKDGKIEKSDVLGRGTFGVVRRIRHFVSGEEFAVKIMEKEKLNALKVLGQVYREIDVMRELDHPCLMRLIGYFENHDHFFLQLEIAVHNILDFQQTFPSSRLPEPLAVYVICRVSSATKYLHGLGYVHRDIKNQNILLTKNFEVKLGDFGAVGSIRGRRWRRNSFTGTPEFMSPECVARAGHSFPYDIWSIGVVFCFCITGAPPFRGKDNARTPELFQSIKEMNYELPKFISPASKHLVTSCLHEEKARPTIRELRNHPVLRYYAEKEMPFSPSYWLQNKNKWLVPLKLCPVSNEWRHSHTEHEEWERLSLRMKVSTPKTSSERASLLEAATALLVKKMSTDSTCSTEGSARCSQ